MARFTAGDTAFIVDNRIFLREVIIKRATKDFCVITYKDTGATIRIRYSRLFTSKEVAENTIPESARPKKKSHWDYEFSHL
jgi:hypothetical protein